MTTAEVPDFLVRSPSFALAVRLGSASCDFRPICSGCTARVRVREKDTNRVRITERETTCVCEREIDVTLSLRHRGSGCTTRVCERKT